VKTLQIAPEVPCQALGYKGSAFDTDSCSSGGFHTQLAGSPLFAETTLSCRPTPAGATTTTTHLQRSSSDSILALIVQVRPGSQPAPQGGVESCRPSPHIIELSESTLRRDFIFEINRRIVTTNEDFTNSLH
jgi:hypothetical protein